MMKKVLALLLVLTLAVGAVAVTATAETAEGYQVGYSKVDINPYWSVWEATSGSIKYPELFSSTDIMPMPMAGYGENHKRLAKPGLVDDNGSGVGASTTNTSSSSNSNYRDVHIDNASQNDGDGLQATAVAIEQNGEVLLIVGVDMINVGADIVEDIKSAIVEQCTSLCPGLTADRILVNANHTHGGVSLSTKYSGSMLTTNYYIAEGKDSKYTSYPFLGSEVQGYLDAYKDFLADRLSDACYEALDTRASATDMQKGTIDAGVQTGKHMNGVRHSVQTYQPKDGSKPAVTYVRGSSFNNDIGLDGGTDSHYANAELGFTASEPVSESDDSLHILKFTIDGADPIVLVNFRAHATANNKQAVLELHYNISSDWGNSLRYELELQGYRAALLYGASGNLGTGVSSDTNKIIASDHPVYKTKTELGESSSDTRRSRWVMPGTLYGKKIAEAALALLGDVAENNNAIINEMDSVAMGPIYSLQHSFRIYKRAWSDKYYAAAKAHDALKASGETITYPWPYEVDGKLVLEDDGTPVAIASQYHANGVITKYESSAASTTIELNTVTLGNQVAFATVPVEASDRYFKDAETLADANLYNDWDLLINNDAWGTPFVLSLTNGANGYIPNKLAYEYNKDYATTTIDDSYEDVNGDGEKTLADYYKLAIGSYESHTAYADKGEGERMVATLNTMLRSTQPKTGYCEHCETDVTWQAFTKQHIEQVDTSYQVQSGHYYLYDNFTYNHQMSVPSGKEVCLDLNGFTCSVEVKSAASRAFTVTGKLNIMDSSDDKAGKVQGLGVRLNILGETKHFTSGTLNISNGGEVNLHSGNLTLNRQDGYGTNTGGVVAVASGATFNMHGGNIYGGRADNGVEGDVERIGGNIVVRGTFNMFGGNISDGEAAVHGGNIYVASGVANLTGGAVTGGSAVNGGNIYVAGGTLTINGTTVTGGTATADGGTLYAYGGTTTLTSGSIGGGSAVNGGGVYLAKAVNLNGGTISGGEATSGGALYVATGVTQTLNGTNISGGEAEDGGSVYLPDGASLVTTSGTTISGGSATNGGCVYLAEGSALSLVNGATISGGSATNGGCLYIPENVTYTMNAGTISGGSATNGGNVCVNGGTLNIQGGTIQQNETTRYGGNVAVLAGTANLNSGSTLDGGSATNGGNVYVTETGVFNLNGGTISGGNASSGGNVYVHAVSVTEDSVTSYTYGTFNMHGGTISGGNATSYGGNIQVQGGIFNLYDGTVSGGDAGTGGNLLVSRSTPCPGTFRMEGGYVDGGTHIMGNLILAKATAGSTPVALKLANNKATLTVEGTYTGNVELTYTNTTYTIATGETIGKAENANIDGAQIKVANAADNQYVAVDGSNLVLRERAYVAKVGDTFYTDIAEAITNYASATNPVMLLDDDLTLTLTKDVKLDLNGHDVTLVNYNGYKLTCMDTATVDCSSEDETTYGSIPANANIQAADSYMMITTGETVSFHYYILEIQTVTLKTSAVGLNYNCVIAGDELVADQVQAFGLAMSVNAPATEQSIFMDAECKTHVWQSGSTWTTGAAGQSLTGVAVKEIMKEEIASGGFTNAQRAEIPVYGIPYLLLNNGEMIFGEAIGRTFRAVVEEVDAEYPELINDALVGVYNTYKDVMDEWEIENLQEEAANA